MSNKNTAARIAANNKYNSKAYDKLTISVPAGTKEKILAQHKSINSYVNKLIADDMLKPPQ